MNRVREIKKIIGDAIAPYEFKVNYSDRNKGACFFKESGDLKQYIDIQIVHLKYLALKFSTNAYQQQTIDGSEFFLRK